MQYQSAGIDLMLPLEHTYRIRAGAADDWLPDHLRLRSRKQSLDIRIFLEPEPNHQRLSPAFRSMCLASHLATNHPDAHISVHSLDQDELKEYRAQWGRQYTFQPKADLSRRAYAQLIAIHRDDLSTAYLLLLFDRPSAEVDLRRYGMRFISPIVPDPD